MVLAHEGLCGMFAAFIHLSSVSVLSSGHCGLEYCLYFGEISPTNFMRKYGQ